MVERDAHRGEQLGQDEQGAFALHAGKLVVGLEIGRAGIVGLVLDDLLAGLLQVIEDRADQAFNARSFQRHFGHGAVAGEQLHAAVACYDSRLAARQVRREGELAFRRQDGVLAIGQFHDQRLGAANGHHRHRGVDLDAAGAGHFSGHEAERTLDQAEQHLVGAGARIVDHLVEHHGAAVAQREYGPVVKGDAQLALLADLDNVTLKNCGADLQFLGRAADALHAGGAFQRLHLADGVCLAGAGRAACLCQLDWPGPCQQFHGMAAQQCAIVRNQGRGRGGVEIPFDGDAAAIGRLQHQVGTCAHIGRRLQQFLGDRILHLCGRDAAVEDVVCSVA